MKKIKAKVEEALKLGYVRVYRSLLDWEWFTDKNTCHLFIYCMLRANHSGQKWQGKNLKRGSFVTSLSKLADNTGLTIREVRTSLNKLKSTNDLTHTTTKQYTVINVRAYCDWQNPEIENDTQNDTQNDTRTTHERQTSDKQTTTDNKVNKVNNIERENRENFEILIRYAKLKGVESPTAYAFKVINQTKEEDLKIVIENLTKEIKKLEEKNAKKIKFAEEKKEEIYQKQEIKAVSEFSDEEILKILKDFEEQKAQNPKNLIKNPVVKNAEKEAQKRGLK